MRAELGSGERRQARRRARGREGRVIVRIATEDQYEIAGDDYTRLNDLDDAVVAAVEAGDKEEYAKRFAELIDYIRSNGKRARRRRPARVRRHRPAAGHRPRGGPPDFTGEGLIPESVLPGSATSPSRCQPARLPLGDAEALAGRADHEDGRVRLGGVGDAL